MSFFAKCRSNLFFSFVLYPFCPGDFPVLVNVCDVLEGLPDLLEQRLRDLVLGAVDLPSAHEADLVLGPEEVAVRQVTVMVQV